jgi:hypothetical protein
MMGCFANARIEKAINNKYKTIIICFLDNKKIIVHSKVLPVEKKLVCFALKTFGNPVFLPPLM